MLSPNTVCASMAMDDSPPSKLCRSISFPSRPPVLSSITRPYVSLTSIPSTKPPPPPAAACGSMASSIKPSALLQRRRSKAGHGFSVSAVNTSTAIGDPPPGSTRCHRRSAYEVLQISPSASQQDIKSAFWRLARLHHPDKVPFEQKDASTITFLQIRSAYVVLKDPEARARHDAQMAMESFPLSGYKQRFSGISVDVTTPCVYKPHTNIFTSRGATAAAASSMPFTPRTQIFRASTTASATPHTQIYTASATASTTPRSHLQSPKPPSTGASPNYYTPRSPYTTRRSWETDQCW